MVALFQPKADPPLAENCYIVFCGEIAIFGYFFVWEKWERRCLTKVVGGGIVMVCSCISSEIKGGEYNVF